MFSLKLFSIITMCSYSDDCAESFLLVLLCYKRRTPQNGHLQRWRNSERARSMRRVAIECGLWHSGRKRATRPEVGWEFGGR